MMRYPICLVFFLSLLACSNTPGLETGEMKIFQLLKNSLNQKNQTQVFVDSRKILTRQTIDSAGVAVLFVKLETGQNGTLTKYPGQGIGETWLGADGATITFNRGILIASRGMGDDVMGGSSSMPHWSKVSQNSTYERKLSYISGNNKLYSRKFSCKIESVVRSKTIRIWEIEFVTDEYKEICNDEKGITNNSYFVDKLNVVRQSRQYHGESIGYIFTQRLERM